MATPKRRIIALVITGILIIICGIVWYNYAIVPDENILNFAGYRFTAESSKSIIIGITIALTILVSILVNLFTGYFHASEKIEKTDNKPTFVVPVPRVEVVIPAQPATQRVETAEPENKKFYPNYFLPDLKFFVGRKEVLSQIRKTLRRDHRAAIHDISGLGKTFTTYKFAADSEDKYDKIFFIRATPEEMMEGLARCGEMVNPQLANTEKQEDKALGFKQWLEENEKWLVIYDNVDRPNELHKYVPVNKKGDCLFTSNFQAVKNLGTEIDINKLNKEDAEILLYSRARNQPHTPPQIAGEEKDAFENLLLEIDGLPLTLNSTGARIFEDQSSFAEFWKQYQHQPELPWESEDNYSPYQRKSAGIVFAMAYGELSQAQHAGEAVNILLNAISFLSPDEIPEELLQKHLHDNYEPHAESKNPSNFWIKVRKGLTGYDLLKYDKEKQVFITHRAIQRVIETLLEKDQIENVCAGLADTLIKLFPVYDHSPAKRAACEKYHQHAQGVAEYCSRRKISLVEANYLFHRLGRYQELLGNFNLAETFFSSASDISAEVFGKEHPDYAIDLTNLAGSYRDQGRFDEAIEKYQEALRIGEKTIGKDHPDSATRLSNLALGYEDQGRYDEAIEKHEEVLRIDEKTIGKEHPEFASHINNLALVYYAQGRHHEAIEKLEEALRIGEKTIGKEHPDYAARLNNLALVYHAQGRHDDAIAKYEEALRIGKRTIGKEHPHYAIQLSNLAAVYRVQGRYDEAIEKHKGALQISEKTLGKKHPEYAIRLNNLAAVYYAQRKYGEALELYESALEIVEKTLPADHPYNISLRESIDRCRKELQSK